MACNGLGNQGRCGRVIQWKDYETENPEHDFTSVGEMLAHSILGIISIKKNFNEKLRFKQHLTKSRYLLQQAHE